MWKTLLIAAAAGLVVPSKSTQAGSSQTSLIFMMNPTAGNPTASRQIRPIRADGKLYDFCRKVIDAMQHGTSSGSGDDFAASDCIGIFIEATIVNGLRTGRPGGPGRGGDGSGIGGMPGGKGGAVGESGQDGQGLPGLPGGKGGAAGGQTGAENNVDEELLDYCDAVLRQSRRGVPATRPVESEDYDLSDCADYFASVTTSIRKGERGGSGARPGSDGPSISGGQGGKGGEPGAGSGGASGGAGGAGVEDGRGGEGGAGGSGY